MILDHVWISAYNIFCTNVCLDLKSALRQVVSDVLILSVKDETRRGIPISLLESVTITKLANDIFPVSIYYFGGITERTAYSAWVPASITSNAKLPRVFV